MVQKIKWTNQAKSDLHDIYRFIARDSIRYAQIQIEEEKDQVIVMSVTHGRRLLKEPPD